MIFFFVYTKLSFRIWEPFFKKNCFTSWLLVSFWFWYLKWIMKVRRPLSVCDTCVTRLPMRFFLIFRLRKWRHFICRFDCGVSCFNPRGILGVFAHPQAQCIFLVELKFLGAPLPVCFCFYFVKGKTYRFASGNIINSEMIWTHGSYSIALAEANEISSIVAPP